MNKENNTVKALNMAVSNLTKVEANNNKVKESAKNIYDLCCRLLGK